MNAKIPVSNIIVSSNLQNNKNTDNIKKENPSPLMDKKINIQSVIPSADGS